MVVEWIQALTDHGTTRPPSFEPIERAAPVTDRSEEDLRDAIENQIIPQLLLAHATRLLSNECPSRRTPPSADEVAQVASLAVAQDMPNLLGRVEAMSRQGVALESLLLDLIAPAARLLGDQWLQDLRSFTDVTLGLGTLQRVVAVLGHKVEPPVSHRGLVVLLAVPGEQHTLAIQLLGELLRQEGWGAHVDPGLWDDELLDLVASEPVVMVGVSVSNTGLIDQVARTVADVKRASMNPDIAVMLGGTPELADHAERLDAVYCPNARSALSWLDEHVEISAGTPND